MQLFGLEDGQSKARWCPEGDWDEETHDSSFLAMPNALYILEATSVIRDSYL
jgi:hypothetical protein